MLSFVKLHSLEFRFGFLTWHLNLNSDLLNDRIVHIFSHNSCLPKIIDFWQRSLFKNFLGKKKKLNPQIFCLIKNDNIFVSWPLRQRCVIFVTKTKLLSTWDFFKGWSLLRWLILMFWTDWDMVELFSTP